MSSLMTSTHDRTLYFAYGSNLQMKQMAQRCPENRFIGLGRLYNYRWHINERGFANIVEDYRRFVDGICYSLNPSDEARLDRSEGVHIEAYEKRKLKIQVSYQPVALVGCDVAHIVNNIGRDTISRGARADTKFRHSDRRSRSVPVNIESEKGKRRSGSDVCEEGGQSIGVLVY